MIDLKLMVSTITDCNDHWRCLAIERIGGPIRKGISGVKIEMMAESG